MRNVLLFVLMISTIVMVYAKVKKNKQENVSDFFNGRNYIEQVSGIDMQMVYVKGGSFILGTITKGDGYSDEYPAVEVSLNSYYIGAFEVSQKQWQIIMGDSIYDNEKLPINGVSWNDAVLFCEKLSELSGKNYQLPTEEQWEYAARGGKNSKNRKYSGSNDVDEVAWYSANSNKELQQVGLKKSNELDLYDMSGNVLEWCLDTYMSYSSKNDTLKKEIGNNKVLRGGCWLDYASSCRVSYRNYDFSSSKNIKNGFRVVCIP